MHAKQFIGILAAVAVLGVGVLFWFRWDSSAPGKRQDLSTGRQQSVDSVSRRLTKNGVPYYTYNEEDFQKAVASKRIIYLEFYANWCPICRAQETELIAGLEALNRSDIVAFRVNFKDDQTDEDEQRLADKYKIMYQHHKIILKKNVVVIDSAEEWDAQMLITELNKL